MLKVIKNQIKTLIKQRNIFRLAEEHVESGFYCFLPENKICKVSKINKMTFPIYYVSKRKRHGTLSQLSYSWGGDKDLLFFNDYVYAYFRNIGQYNYAKKNYRRIELLNYPHCNYELFDDSKKMIRMNKVTGCHFVDHAHDMLLIKKLFVYALNAVSKIDDDGMLKCVQHRDVRRCNVMWVNDEEFFFIDLDCIGFASLLFDVIHYCNDNHYHLEELLNIFRENETVFNQIIEKYQSYLGENPLDQIFYDYSSFYKRIGRHYDSLLIFSSDLMSQFPKTQMLLSTILR